MEENKVIGLRLFHEGTEVNVATDKLIDATGEAAICHIAGCESFSGRDFDKHTQPFTFTSIAINSNGKTSCLNIDSGSVNQHDPREVSRAIITANNYPMYLKDDYSKENIKFLTIAPLLGVREGRMIKGRKTLEFKDVISLQNQEDKPLFYSLSNIDNHGKDMGFENEELCDWLVASGLWGVLFSVPVPLDVLIPNNLENIMVAGRCLSVDHDLASAVRMQRDMSKCGEAAAYVCYEAIKNKILLSEVVYNNIVSKLKESKCLDYQNNIGFMERVKGTNIGNKLPEIQTPAEVTDWLASEKPGWGIWYAKVLSADNHEIIDVLKENLNANNENLSRNSALALGLIGENSALDKLRQIAKEPDNYVPESSLKYVYTRGVSAIYLLGKMNDVSSIDLLFDIVERRGITNIDGFKLSEFYWEDKDVFSQYVLFSTRALVDIARKNLCKSNHIIEKLLHILEPADYKVMITLKANSESLYDLKPKLIEYVKSII